MADFTPDPVQALRDGLRRIPVPQPGPDFDDRVIAALQVRRRSWWLTLLGFARPMASAAACSLVATLALLHWSLSTPAAKSATPAAVPPPAATATSTPAGEGFTMAALDRALSQPDLREGTIARLLESPETLPDPVLTPPAPPPASPVRPRKPPDRRDGLAPHRDPFLA